MQEIKKENFVEIEYTGKIKDDNTIFDTTNEKKAKDNNIFNQGHEYGTIKVMVGGNQVLPGIDRFMVGKTPGEYKVGLEAKDGFGKKDPKLLKLLPKSLFTKQKINPVPGLPINIDNANGVIKTVSGGRCIVDFNHPLSGKELIYDLKINRIITDDKEKVESIMNLQTKKENFDLAVVGENATITLKVGFQKPLKDLIADMIKKFTKIKKVEFKEDKETNSPSKKEEKK
jgi:FKBP-type peptidyl-prolyl cis-trans isomerase SlyD